MKKTIIIVTGIIFLFLLVGVWAYLFFVGTPESADDVFGNLSFGDSAAPITTTEDENAGDDNDLATDQTDSTPASLSQLTTVPVAGFSFLANNGSSTTSELMYVEQGTGHVYHYQLDNQQRTRVSNTTVPETRTAYIDTEGLYTVLQTPTALRILSLEENGTSTDTTLTGRFDNVLLTADERIYYTQTDAAGTTGYQYDITSESTTELFSAPLQDIRVLWNEEGDHHVYNAPAETLEGYLYRVNGNTLRRTPISGTGLEVMYGPEEDSYIYTTQDIQDMPISQYWTASEQQRLSGFMRPSKCVTSNQEIWCAFAVTDTTNVTDWYQGTHSFSDSLWQINPSSGSSRLEVSFGNASGREVDVEQLTSDDVGEYFLFRNKRDGYLWTYDIN